VRTKKTSLMKIAIFSVMMLLLVAPTFANLVTNGGFNGYGSWSRGGNVWIHGGIVHFSEHNRYPNGRVWQNVNTEIGQEYRVEFDYAAHGYTAPGGMRVRMYIGAAVLVETVTASLDAWDWRHASYTFVANQTSTRIYFNDASSRTVAVDMHLDNASVVASYEAPVLDVPDDLVVYANSAGGFSGFIGEASASDDCDPDPSISNDAPALFPLGDTEVTWTATDESGNFSTAIQIVTVEPFPIIVDIKPGNDNNNINPRSNGVIPVAILTDETFDATSIDVSSLRFGPGEAETAHNGHIEDVDDDGDDDLMLHFRTRDTGVSNSDISLCMTGLTESGIPIAGCDGINGNVLPRPIPGNAEGIVPSTLSLEQNYPNPFNPSTVIGYGLPEAASVSLIVYDMRGAVVANLVNDYQQAGLYQIEFDGSSLSSGTYIYVLNANGNRFVKRFSLMK